jgi:hypothetical protein
MVSEIACPERNGAERLSPQRSERGGLFRGPIELID